jgi:Ca2+-binding EF-hand superfamily protein
MGDLIKKIDERGEFVYLEDGFLYYAPEGKGCISAHELRTIADELDKRNKAWEEQIDEYFRSGFGSNQIGPDDGRQACGQNDFRDRTASIDRASYT